jgi:hypothetical protein
VLLIVFFGGGSVGPKEVRIMQSLQRWSIVGLVGLIGASGRAPAADTDRAFTTVTGMLAARASSTPEGRIEYRNHRWVTTIDRYTALREPFIESHRHPLGSGQLLEQLRHFVQAEPITSLTTSSGTIAFDHARLRFTRRIEQRPMAPDLILSERAAEAGASYVRDDVQSQDILYAPPTLSEVRNHEIMHIGDAPQRPPFRLMHLDLSLGPWAEALRPGANVPGQFISTVMSWGEWCLTYTNHSDSERTSFASYYFSPRLDMAPTRAGLVAGEKLQREDLYGYEVRGGAVQRPAAVSHARFKPDGAVRVDLWLIARWDDAVVASDLELDVPDRLFVIDESGGGPRAYYRDGVDVMGFERQRFLIEPCSIPIADAVNALLDEWGERISPYDLNRDMTVDHADLFALIDALQ